MQLIVGDKRVNVTVRAKGAMTVIIALKGEELHKAGLPSRYIEVRWVPSATCPLVVAEGRGQRAGRAIERANLVMVRADWYQSCA